MHGREKKDLIEYINYRRIMILDDIKERIELLRKQEFNKEMNQRAQTDKTSKSKDIIIMTKDKKIKELEN